jgi:hypothetical protein
MSGDDEVVAALSAALAAAEAVYAERQGAITEAHRAVVVARQAGREADRRVKALRRMVESYGVSTGPIGRPLGGDPGGVQERVRVLLPAQEIWTGAELRDAMAARQGFLISVNRVSAALAHLAKNGQAVRVAPGKWSAVVP